MVERLAAAEALRVLTRRLRTGAARTVLVDGRSGAGKSTFAGSLARAARVPLLRLEEVYPGWDGLDRAAAGLVDHVLRPRVHGTAGALQRWDWAGDRPGTALRIPPGRPLVVEGCGALTRAAARLADTRVWIELDDASRRRRAIARDGEAYAPHWERWARQERRFIAREDPGRLADLVVDGRSFP